MITNSAISEYLIALVVGLGCVVVASAQAASLGDPKAGEAYAKTHCASCHSIERDGSTSPVKAATPFQAVADTSGITRTALYVFFRTPHKNMPNLIVKGDDLDNIVAFILSLKTAKP